MRVEVVGTLNVLNGEDAVTGGALGGRRARVVLVALALAEGQLSADHLATVIWGDELPPTWPTALRGVVRSVRASCAPLCRDGEQIIVTGASGYALAAGVEVDIDAAAVALDRAAELMTAGRHRAVLEFAEPISRMAGDQLLPDEDADWLAPHRRSVDALALRAMELVVGAAGALGLHDQAIALARRFVASDGMEERAHRALIAALDRAGDRAGSVSAFESCRAMLADSLGVEPSTSTVEVYLKALGEDTRRPAAHMPSTRSSFVGRAEELRRVEQAIGRAGIVTIAGRGGVGKSRVAERAARSPDYSGGRIWVSLAAMAQDELVAATVALAVGVTAGGDAVAALAEHLAPLGRALVVLDGAEVVIDGVGSLAADLVAACPQLTLVVTTRVPLRIDGEVVVAIEPLPEPSDADAEALRDNVQVVLLADRVREAGGRLDVDATLAPHVAALVRRCGGLPLALELVAAQLAVIPAGDLVDHIDELVVAGDDQVRSVARSTYALLDEEEATVFRRLGVLDGSPALPLVRQVVARDSVPATRVVRILRELAARGLVSVDRSGPRLHYRQDDDLHRYAREMLAARGEEHAAFDALANATRSVLPDDARSAPAPFQAEISQMLASIRSLFAAALDGSADTGACLELAFRLHRYFAATDIAEGRFWLQRLLAAAPDAVWAPYATYALGYLSYWSGDTMEAVEQLRVAVDLLEGVDGSYAARALIYLAGLLDDLDRSAEAVEYVRRGIAAAAPFGVDLQVSAAMGMGSVLAERGDPSAAYYAHDAIELCRRGGSLEQLALALPTAAMVCWQVGAYEQCRQYVTEAQPMHGDTRRIARVVLLSTAAGLALSDGDLDAAVELGTQADNEATELRVEREAPLIRTVLARAFLARGDIAGAAERAAAALDAARSMAIAFQLAICLETAALVAMADGGRSSVDGASLLATAAGLRARGERRPLPALAEPVDRLRAAVGTELAAVISLDVDAAVRIARDALAECTARAPA